jgi:hypothetical protein
MHPLAKISADQAAKMREQLNSLRALGQSQPARSGMSGQRLRVLRTCADGCTIPPKPPVKTALSDEDQVWRTA